ncbi:inositol-3-phosphate synthase [candidate division MSBL1 archaeon SCGC-AAA259A05]|uniref:Inositol-3-phosphate synthase n=1 Tax=candidate division MSBL1 archaeon SCGC-AAA259A05 TaxID=1698259 RepID=A0A133U4A6_9EURY|nr:inositol-3-phosphate synthase [candidate division MSBL1 archaeon SCGC-AAA259A05]
MSKVNVAIAGVGNCASSLVQGVEYYKDSKEGESIPGLMHVNFGGYHVRDINFVAAFDVDANKVGKDLSDAIFTKPNCTIKFSDVPNLNVEVMKGPTLDGLGKYLKGKLPVDKTQESVDVVRVLEDRDVDVLISYMPVGSFEASRFYAKAALKAGVGFVNCIPEFIVSDEEWAGKFEEAGVPCAGDDIKSQVGATILHRTITNLLKDRGVKVEESYQLNVGGNTDFLNMLEEERLSSKRTSKTEAVSSQVPYEVPLRIGPSDYVPFLDDNKVCHIYVKGRKFGDVPLTIDVKLSVEDSPNSAGVVIDALRAVKLAQDREVGGRLTSISAYSFKHPPEQMTDSEAKQAVEEFISGERER